MRESTLIAMAILALVGCTDVDQQLDSSATSAKVSFTLEAPAESRVAIDAQGENWAVRWQEGEKLGGWCSDGAAQSAFSEFSAVEIIDNGLSATFEGYAEGTMLRLLYPYQSEAAISNGCYEIDLTQQSTTSLEQLIPMMSEEEFSLAGDGQITAPWMRHLGTVAELEFSFSGANSEASYTLHKLIIEGCATTATVDMTKSFEEEPLSDIGYGELTVSPAVTTSFDPEQGLSIPVALLPFSLESGAEISGSLYYTSTIDGVCEMMVLSLSKSNSAAAAVRFERATHNTILVECDMSSATKFYDSDDLTNATGFGASYYENTMGLKTFYTDYFDNYLEDRYFSVVDDFGMAADTPDVAQSERLQAAIIEISEGGGGILYFPFGEYKFRDIYMKSNVHILVEEGTIFHPDWDGIEAGAITGNKTKVHLFLFTYDGANSDQDYIENCSIRATSGFYRIYIDPVKYKSTDGWFFRFINCRMVKNFKISDFYIEDAFTTYCVTELCPSNDDDCHSWPDISRPTNGEISHCVALNLHPGYGLCQVQGAERVYFEDLYSTGGVTMRLESGAADERGGVYDMHGRNIRSESGYMALMMGPHLLDNGEVRVDGVWSRESTKTVGAGLGETDANGHSGSYASTSKIMNIHSIYGDSNAQVPTKEAYLYTDDEALKLTCDRTVYDNNAWLRGPSICVITDATEDNYDVEFANITYEGFPDAFEPIIYVFKASEAYINRFKTYKAMGWLNCAGD